MSKLVKFVRKQILVDRYDIITHIGGDWGMVTQAEAIKEIKKDPNAYYVKVSVVPRLTIAKHLNHEYLITEGDEMKRDFMREIPDR